MSEFFEMSFLELRSKEVINVIDGRRLGRVCDVILGGHKGHLKGIVVPFSRRFFFKSQDIFIPFECIDKIGEDAILVRVRSHNHHHDKHKKSHGGGGRGHHGGGPHIHFHQECHDRGHGGHNDKECHHSKHGHHDRDCHHGHHDRDCHSGDSHQGHHQKCDEHGCHEQVHRPHMRGDCKDHDKKEKDHHHKDRPKCDRKCEKCMLFDCAFRWLK
ncbi:MAG: YlmC/YmxH family sporulation protein [Firmicutes bacterium]|nr:YlmC/YmxH family sporulation protein [Bacillota bacterium]